MSGRKSPSIADDWSEVEGDTASIRSTESSDEDEFCLLPEFNKAPEPRATSSTTTADVKDKQPLSKPADDFEKQPLYAVSWKEKKPEVERGPEPPAKVAIIAVEKAKVVEKKHKEPVTAPIPIEPTKKQPKKPVLNEPDETGLGDSKNSNDFLDQNDPDYYYQFLVELHSQMGSAVKEAEAVKLSNHPTVLITRATCQEVHVLLGELKLIHAAYAGAWLTDGAKIPLSPDLLSWMQNVNAEVDNVASVLAKIGRPQFGYAPPSSHGISDESSPHLVDLAECCENLDSARATLENFLPIIKADFDEFKTSSISFPRYQAPAGETRKERPRQPPNPSVSRLRRELYDLKDELQITLVFLTRLQHEVPAGTLPDAPDALRSLRDLIVAISTILTNNGSDWLERDLGSSSNRTISHSIFINLDADILHDVKKHVQEFNTQLDVSSEPLFQQYSATMIQNHQITSLVEGGQMYNLLSIISLLESVLMAEGGMI